MAKSKLEPQKTKKRRATTAMKVAESTLRLLRVVAAHRGQTVSGLCGPVLARFADEQYEAVRLEMAAAKKAG